MSGGQQWVFSTLPLPSPLTGVSKLKQGKGEDVLSLLRHAHLCQT